MRNAKGDVRGDIHDWLLFKGFRANKSRTDYRRLLTIEADGWTGSISVGFDTGNGGLCSLMISKENGDSSIKLSMSSSSWEIIKAILEQQLPAKAVTR